MKDKVWSTCKTCPYWTLRYWTFRYWTLRVTDHFRTEGFLTERFLTKPFLIKRFFTEKSLTERNLHKTYPVTKHFLPPNFSATKRLHTKDIPKDIPYFVWNITFLNVKYYFILIFCHSLKCRLVRRFCKREPIFSKTETE